jgi:hypothetical protein
LPFDAAILARDPDHYRRTPYALFFRQISKAHTTREAVAVEAFERGAVVRRSVDFPGDPPATPALAAGYEIRPIPEDA